MRRWTSRTRSATWSEGPERGQPGRGPGRGARAGHSVHRSAPERSGPGGRGRDAALGLAHDGPAHRRVRGGVRRASRGEARRGGVQLHRRAAPRLPGRRRRSRGRGDRALVHVRGHRGGGALLRRHAGLRRHRRARGPGDRPGRGRGADQRPHQGRGLRALRRLPRGRGPPRGAVRASRPRADRGRGARAQRHPRRPQARHDRPGRRVLASSPTRSSRSARAACWPPTTTTWPPWRAAAARTR